MHSLPKQVMFLFAVLGFSLATVGFAQETGLAFAENTARHYDGETFDCPAELARIQSGCLHMSHNYGGAKNQLSTMINSLSLTRWVTQWRRAPGSDIEVRTFRTNAGNLFDLSIFSVDAITTGVVFSPR